MASKHRTWSSICKEAYTARYGSLEATNSECDIDQWDSQDDKFKAYKETCREIINGFLELWGYNLNYYKKNGRYEIPSGIARFFLNILKQDTKKGSLISKIKGLEHKRKNQKGYEVFSSNQLKELDKIKPQEIQDFIDKCLPEAMDQNCNNPDHRLAQLLRNLCEEDINRIRREKEVRDKVYTFIKETLDQNITESLSNFSFTQVGKVLIDENLAPAQGGSQIGEEATKILLLYLEQLLHCSINHWAQLVEEYESEYVALEGKESLNPDQIIRKIGGYEEILQLAKSQLDDINSNYCDIEFSHEVDKINNIIRFTVYE